MTWTREQGLNKLLKSTSVDWSTGGTAARTVEIPAAYTRATMISVNGNTTAALTVTVSLEHQVSTSWLPAKSTAGQGLSFPCTTAASTNHQGTFGAFDHFPRFDGGRFSFATTAASTDASLAVQIWAV